MSRFDAPTRPLQQPAGVPRPVPPGAKEQQPGIYFRKFLAYLAAAVVVGLLIRATDEYDRGIAYTAAGVIVLGVLVVDQEALRGLSEAIASLQGTSGWGAGWKPPGGGGGSGGGQK